jgi:hypothetical protein
LGQSPGRCRNRNISRAAEAADQAAFTVDMTHAFYAKVYCSRIDLDYEGFVAAAKAKNLSPGIVEEVRNGVAFLNTNGQMEQRLSKDVMDTVTVAAKMVALDHKTGGAENWCEHRSEFLLKDGFLKRAPNPSDAP